MRHDRLVLRYELTPGHRELLVKVRDFLSGLPEDTDLSHLNPLPHNISFVAPLQRGGYTTSPPLCVIDFRKNLNKWEKPAYAKLMNHFFELGYFSLRELRETTKEELLARRKGTRVAGHAIRSILFVLNMEQESSDSQSSTPTR